MGMTARTVNVEGGRYAYEKSALAAAVALAATAYGCMAFNARFEPISAAAPNDRIADRAIEYFAADTSTLQNAPGAVPLGVLELAGNELAEWDDFIARAGKEAAEHGGTHFLTTREVVRDWAHIAPGQATTYRWYGGSSTTYTPPHRTTTSTSNVFFYVVRVPRDSWQGLPPNLRPKAP
jgi:hypothetical protein